jgi:hypothetical protein
MAKKYTLHYLSDKEFDKLPYRLANTAWGAADEKTGNAYVRRTGLRPIDEFIAEHELAELIAKVSPHEVDGIRYKVFGNNNPLKGSGLDTLLGGEDKAGNPTATTQVTPSGQGVSNPSGTPNTADTQLNNANAANANKGTVTGSLGASTTTPTNTSTINQPSTSTGSGLTDAFNNYQSNQLGFASSPVSLGGQTSYVSPNLSTINTNTPTSQNSFSSPNSIASMFTTNQATSSNLGTPVTLGGQTSNVTGGANGLTATPTSASSNLGFESPTSTTSTSTKANVPLQSINQSKVSPTLQGGSEVSSQNQKVESTSKTPFLESIFGKDWRQTLLGAGISALGQATAGKTQTVNPADSQLYNDVVEQVKSGVQVELTTAQRDAISYNYDQQLENARKNITARFKALRPGSDISNDSQLQSALVELENDFAEQKAAAITAAQLGLTQTQTAQLSQLAALDVNSLAINAGISNQEAADFKNMMASLGAMVAQGGQQQRVYS